MSEMLGNNPPPIVTKEEEDDGAVYDDSNIDNDDDLENTPDNIEWKSNKRQIKLLNTAYLNVFIEEFQDLISG